MSIYQKLEEIKEQPEETINPVTLDSTYITNEDIERTQKFIKRMNAMEEEILNDEEIF